MNIYIYIPRVVWESCYVNAVLNKIWENNHYYPEKKLGTFWIKNVCHETRLLRRTKCIEEWRLRSETYRNGERGRWWWPNDLKCIVIGIQGNTLLRQKTHQAKEWCPIECCNEIDELQDKGNSFGVHKKVIALWLETHKKIYFYVQCISI